MQIAYAFLIDSLKKLFYTEVVNENQPQTSPQTPAVPTPTPNAFPPMKMLFIEAWELLKRTATSQVRLILLLTACVVGLVLAVLLVVFLGNVVVGFMGSGGEIMSIVGALLLVVVYVFALIYITAISQIVSVKIYSSEPRIALIPAIKQAYPLVWPFFGTIFLGQVYILGGMFAFIVPGMIMAFLFMFVGFVFVVENTRGMAALQRSYQLIRPHVKSILLTLILAEVSYYVLSNLFSYFSQKYIWLYILTIPLSIGFSLYLGGLSYVLFKHAKAANPTTPLPNFKWVKIWSTIGFVIFGILVAFSLFIIVSQLTSGPMKLPPIK